MFARHSPADYIWANFLGAFPLAKQASRESRRSISSQMTRAEYRVHMLPRCCEWMVVGRVGPSLSLSTTTTAELGRLSPKQRLDVVYRSDSTFEFSRSVKRTLDFQNTHCLQCCFVVRRLRLQKKINKKNCWPLSIGRLPDVLFLRLSARKLATYSILTY